MWRPLLTICLLACLGCAQARPFERPAAIRFGASAAHTDAALSSLCQSKRTRVVAPPFLPDVRTQQLQIDCEGLPFLGRPRHVEFVFRDNRLVMVWLMVTSEERETVITALTSAYGQPTGRNQNYVAFERNRIAWRSRPPEILFYAPELDPDMAPDFR